MNSATPLALLSGQPQPRLPLMWAGAGLAWGLALGNNLPKGISPRPGKPSQRGAGLAGVGRGQEGWFTLALTLALANDLPRSLQEELGVSMQI